MNHKIKLKGCVSSWQKAFVNAKHLKGSTYVLTVFDIMGKVVFKDASTMHGSTTHGSTTHGSTMHGSTPHGSTPLTMTGGYFTKDLDCSAFSNGMYIINLTTNKEQLSQKFIKN
jgi:hypothetical protein